MKQHKFIMVARFTFSVCAPKYGQETCNTSQGDRDGSGTNFGMERLYIYTYVNGYFWNGLNLEILISRIQEMRERAVNIKVN